MKILAVSLLSIAAIVFIGACDGHTFKETQVLHEKYQDHGHGHSDHHAEGGEHKAEAGHGAAKDGHAAPAAEHGEKKAH